MTGPSPTPHDSCSDASSQRSPPTISRAATPSSCKASARRFPASAFSPPQRRWSIANLTMTGLIAAVTADLASSRARRKRPASPRPNRSVRRFVARRSERCTSPSWEKTSSTTSNPAPSHALDATATAVIHNLKSLRAAAPMSRSDGSASEIPGTAPLDRIASDSDRSAVWSDFASITRRGLNSPRTGLLSRAPASRITCAGSTKIKPTPPTLLARYHSFIASVASPCVLARPVGIAGMTIRFFALTVLRCPTIDHGSWISQRPTASPGPRRAASLIARVTSAIRARPGIGNPPGPVTSRIS